VQNLNGIDSKFRLAILVARRAKQLIGGAKKKVEVKSDNPLTVALEEFKQGKIDFDVLYEEQSIFGDANDSTEGTVEAGEADGNEAAAENATEGTQTESES
jgi:DNA-directed RNA polymerase subunit omega